MAVQDREYMRRPPDDDGKGDGPAQELRPEQRFELFFKRNWKLLTVLGLVVVAVVIAVTVSSGKG